MQFARRTAQLLHEDHRTSLSMIEELEQLLARARRRPPNVNDPSTNEVLSRIAASIEQEVRDHFAFEEEQIFTRLADIGESDIGDHLHEEHQAILPVGERVSTLARQALKDGFTDTSWSEFKMTAGELAERLLAHIQKEEMALLPVLEELLDPETDLELADRYGATV